MLQQVPYITEKEKVTLPDLLSNIGGIVGICLGVSLITIFDIIEQICSRIQFNLLARRIGTIEDEKH